MFIVFSWFDIGASFQDIGLVLSKSFEINWPQNP